MNLKEIILEARAKNVAIGHFNVSDIAGLKAVFNIAREMDLPVMIGVSEGERDFIGVRQIAVLVKSLREEYNFPIFLNADHTHSIEKIKEALEAGFDEVLFDAGKESFEQNIALTKEVVNMVREFNAVRGTNVLVEGELGYIGGGSVILDRIPEGVSIKSEDLTKPEEAKRFVEETGVDLLAPAVGNIHGMFEHVSDPNLDINRVAMIYQAVGIPLVLHGASGNTAIDIQQSIDAGVGVVHINTEIRAAWKRGIDMAMLSRPKEITPYKILPEAIHEMEKVIREKMKIFNKIS